MIKGLISHKVRQSAPKPPVKKCSPPRSEASGKRGRKTSPKEQVSLLAASIAGFDKQRFPHIPNALWNALSTTIRSLVSCLYSSSSRPFLATPATIRWSWLDPKPRIKPEEEPPEVAGRHYTGTFKGCDYAMELTEIEFHRMGLDKAKVIQLIGDGAEWIWNRAENFKVNDEQELVLTLDLYHARERVSKVATAFS